MVGSLEHLSRLPLSPPSHSSPQIKPHRACYGFISPAAINRLHPAICILSNQAKEARLRRQDPGVQLINMEIYAAHKQTGARLIRVAPLIHRQHPAHTSPGLFLVSFTKQMYLIRRDTPELRKTDRQRQKHGKAAPLQGTGLGPVVKVSRNAGVIVRRPHIAWQLHRRTEGSTGMCICSCQFLLWALQCCP